MCFPTHLQDNPTNVAIRMLDMGNQESGKSTLMNTLATDGHIFSQTRHTKVIVCFTTHLQDNPTNVAIKMLVLGSQESGKSILVKALATDCHIFSRTRHRFTKFIDVDKKSAEIIPFDICSKKLGHVTMFDFAGDSNYYTTHDTLLHNSMTSSPMFISPVVYLRDEQGKNREMLQYWFQFIESCSSERDHKPPYLLIIGSRTDEISSVDLRLKSSLLQSVVSSQNLDNSTFVTEQSVHYQYAKSSFMFLLHSLLSQRCQSLRDSEEITVADYSFLLDKFSRVASDLRCNPNRDKHVYLKCVKSFDPVEVCGKLNNCGIILFMKNHKHPKNCWIMFNKGVLSWVNGVVIAPVGFREYQNVSTSTGVVPLSKLPSPFPNLNSDMVTQFLCHLEFCHEIADTTFLVSDCMSPAAERFFLFPGLVHVQDPPQDLNNQSVLSLNLSEVFIHDLTQVTVVSIDDVAQTVKLGKEFATIDNKLLLKLEKVLYFEPCTYFGEAILQELSVNEHIFQDITDKLIYHIASKADKLKYSHSDIVDIANNLKKTLR